MSTRDILAIPGRGMAKANPFPALLVESLEERGWLVCGNEPAKILTTKFRALVLHWPEHSSTVPKSTFVAWFRTFSFFVLIACLKLRGTKVVRIAHNVEEHLQHRKTLRLVNRKLSEWLTDSYIYLSQSSMDEFTKKYPGVLKRSSQLLFHPRYGNLLDPAEMRYTSCDENVIRFVGDIHAYKGLDQFLELYATADTSTVFEIIGQCKDHVLGRSIQDSIDKAILNGKEVLWQNRRPSLDELNQLVRTSTAVVLPYLRGSNSGLAVSILEQGVPVMCTDLPLFTELSDVLGVGWVCCFSPNSTDVEKKMKFLLQQSFEERDFERLAAYLNELNWSTFASQIEKSF